MKCGRDNEDGTKFCTGCGADLDNEPKAAANAAYSEQQQQQQQSQSYPGKGLSIASLVLGICALLGTVLPVANSVVAIVGLVLGIIGKKQSAEADGPTGLATAGIIVCGVVLGLSVIYNIACIGCAGCLLCRSVVSS